MTTMVSRRIVLVCYFLALFCMSSVKSEENESSERKNAKPVLSFGFDTNVIITAEIKDVRTALDSWMAKAAEENNIEQTTHIYTDFNSLFNSMKSGQLNAALISSLNYLYLSRKIDVEASFGALRSGKKTEKYILIVPAKSEISDINMLRGKKVVLRERDDIGELFLNILLLRNKIEQADKYFSNIIYKRSPSQVILSVFFGQADACIAAESVFNTMTELNPQVGSQLKVIAESNDLVSVVYCFSRSFDSETRLKVKDWLLNFGTTIRGKQLLDLFKIDGVYIINESDLSSIKSLLNEYEKLNRKQVIMKLQTGSGSK